MCNICKSPPIRLNKICIVFLYKPDWMVNIQSGFCCYFIVNYTLFYPYDKEKEVAL